MLPSNADTDTSASVVLTQAQHGSNGDDDHRVIDVGGADCTHAAVKAQASLVELVSRRDRQPRSDAGPSALQGGHLGEKSLQGSVALASSESDTADIMLENVVTGVVSDKSRPVGCMRPALEGAGSRGTGCGSEAPIDTPALESVTGTSDRCLTDSEENGSDAFDIATSEGTGQVDTGNDADSTHFVHKRIESTAESTGFADVRVNKEASRTVHVPQAHLEMGTQGDGVYVDCGLGTPTAPVAAPAADDARCVFGAITGSDPTSDGCRSAVGPEGEPPSVLEDRGRAADRASLSTVGTSREESEETLVEMPLGSESEEANEARAAAAHRVDADARGTKLYGTEPRRSGDGQADVAGSPDEQCKGPGCRELAVRGPSGERPLLCPHHYVLQGTSQPIRCCVLRNSGSSGTLACWRETDWALPGQPPSRCVAHKNAGMVDAVAVLREKFSEVVWPKLLEQGWHVASKRGSRYTCWMPPNVVRGSATFKFRKDYFDGRHQVIRYCLRTQQHYGWILAEFLQLNVQVPVGSPEPGRPRRRRASSTNSVALKPSHASSVATLARADSRGSNRSRRMTPKAAASASSSAGLARVDLASSFARLARAGIGRRDNRSSSRNAGRGREGRERALPQPSERRRKQQYPKKSRSPARTSPFTHQLFSVSPSSTRNNRVGRAKGAKGGVGVRSLGTVFAPASVHIDIGVWPQEHLAIRAAKLRADGRDPARVTRAGLEESDRTMARFLGIMEVRGGDATAALLASRRGFGGRSVVGEDRFAAPMGASSQQSGAMDVRAQDSVVDGAGLERPLGLWEGLRTVAGVASSRASSVTPLTHEDVVVERAVRRRAVHQSQEGGAAQPARNWRSSLDADGNTPVRAPARPLRRAGYTGRSRANTLDALGGDACSSRANNGCARGGLEDLALTRRRGDDNHVGGDQVTDAVAAATVNLGQGPLLHGAETNAASVAAPPDYDDPLAVAWQPLPPNATPAIATSSGRAASTTTMKPCVDVPEPPDYRSSSRPSSVALERAPLTATAGWGNDHEVAPVAAGRSATLAGGEERAIAGEYFSAPTGTGDDSKDDDGGGGRREERGEGLRQVGSKRAAGCLVAMKNNPPSSSSNTRRLSGRRR